MRSRPFLLVALVVAVVQFPGRAIPLSQFNVPITENFDALASSGTTNTIMPAGWSFRETGSGGNLTYAAGVGSSATGNTYSFGAASSSERALGAVRSSSVAVAFGTVVSNQTGAVITDLAIAYVGEQWRLGTLGRFDRLDFAYSLDAVDLGAGTWMEVNQLDFASPKTTGSLGALDGNSVGNRADVAHRLTGLSLAPGTSLMLRWVDMEATGSDDGLAIDDFSITAVREVPVVVAETLPAAMTSMALGGVVLLASLGRRFPPRG